MNWCYKPGKKPSFLASTPPVPPTLVVTASPSQVLLKELEFRDLVLANATDLFTLGSNITVELFGEKTVNSSDTVTCSFTFDDFQSYNRSIIYDKEMTLSDEEDLGGCYRVYEAKKN